MRPQTSGRLLEVLIAPVLFVFAAAQTVREAWRPNGRARTLAPPGGTGVLTPPAPGGGRGETLQPGLGDAGRAEGTGRLEGDRPSEAGHPAADAQPTGLFSLLKLAAKEWSEDNAPRLGAALSYYTIFSLAPILVIAIAVAGLVFGEEAARGQIVDQIQGLVGRDGAEMVQTMLANTQKPGQGILAFVGGGLALLLGATGAFLELQNALNTVWEVQPKKAGGIKGTVLQRVRAFGLVFGIGFLLLVSLVVSAALAAFDQVLDRMLGVPGWVLQVANFGVSLGVLTVMFALMYRFIPDVRIAWRDVWVGAAVTAALFTIGKYLIGLYLGQSSTASTFGAAGSVVVLLVWIYYSAQIVLFGAEVTQVYANHYGSRIRPDAKAIPVS